jgi:hypothetical protein
MLFRAVQLFMVTVITIHKQKVALCSLVIGCGRQLLSYSCGRCLVTATKLQDSLSVCHSVQHTAKQSPHLKLISVLQIKVKVKVQFTLEQATKAQRGDTGIVILFL